MKTILRITKPASWLSLALIVIPPVMHMSGSMTSDVMNQIMLTGTGIWFITASLWMKGE